jgi:hypothetical protein
MTITLYRFDTQYHVVTGDDALRLHDYGYPLAVKQEPYAVFIPADSIGFHVWQILAHEDIRLAEKTITVTSRTAYLRAWQRFTGRLRTKSWKQAKADFEFETHAMIIVAEDVPEQMPLL